MNLKPVDFKAVAERGFYIYCYLRDDLTPYYIGQSGNAERPYQRSGHSCPVPKDNQRWRARPLLTGLTKKQVDAAEILLISWFGRKLDGGILWNQNYGGEGNLGYRHTDEMIAHLKAKGDEYAEQTRTEQSLPTAKRLEVEGYITVKEYMSLDSKSKQAFRKYLQRNPQGSYEEWSTQTHSEYSRRGTASKTAAAAARVGCTVEEWLELTVSKRTSVRNWLRRHPEATFYDWQDGVRFYGAA